MADEKNQNQMPEEQLDKVAGGAKYENGNYILTQEEYDSLKGAENWAGELEHAVLNMNDDPENFRLIVGLVRKLNGLEPNENF